MQRRSTLISSLCIYPLRTHAATQPPRHHARGRCWRSRSSIGRCMDQFLPSTPSQRVPHPGRRSALHDRSVLGSPNSQAARRSNRIDKSIDRSKVKTHSSLIRASSSSSTGPPRIPPTHGVNTTGRPPARARGAAGASPIVAAPWGGRAPDRGQHQHRARRGAPHDQGAFGCSTRLCVHVCVRFALRAPNRSRDEGDDRPRLI